MLDYKSIKIGNLYRNTRSGTHKVIISVGHDYDTTDDISLGGKETVVYCVESTNYEKASLRSLFKTLSRYYELVSE